MGGLRGYGDTPCTDSRVEVERSTDIDDRRGIMAAEAGS